jgi:hypothetical protein
MDYCSVAENETEALVRLYPVGMVRGGKMVWAEII